MEKKVALYTLHEILVTLDKPAIAKNIVIVTDPKISNSAENFVIKIKHDLGNNCLKIIGPICEKSNLKIEKLDDAFVIH